MRRLWQDITEHPIAAVLFLAYWLAFWVVHWSLGWNTGIPGPGVIYGFGALVIAGGLVAWWRAPAGEGLLVERRRLAGGPLAALLVMLVDLVLVFAPDYAHGIRDGSWEWSAVVEFPIVCAIFGLFAIGLGWIGALVGAGLARLAGKGAHTG